MLLLNLLGKKRMISVLILTKNEACNIEACVQSCSWSDDILVFDSYSTDETAEKAESLGARVFKREFDNYGAQREAARCLPYKYPWVLAVDADERPEPALVEEMYQLVQQPGQKHLAFRLRRKDHFMGRWIKHSTLYPSWFVRLYRHADIFYEARAVHEYPHVPGIVGELTGHLLHDSFSKGLEEWFVKHCRYATLEAQENLKLLSNSSSSSRLFNLISLDPVQRRRKLKELSVRVPFRPYLRFLYSYVFRMGFLDGIAGYRYAKMLAMYEQMIVLNMRDIQFKSQKQAQT